MEMIETTSASTRDGKQRMEPSRKFSFSRPSRRGIERKEMGRGREGDTGRGGRERYWHFWRGETGEKGGKEGGGEVNVGELRH